MYYDPTPLASAMGKASTPRQLDGMGPWHK
jgi:hypothetical protein